MKLTKMKNEMKSATDRLKKINNIQFKDGLFEAHKTNTPMDGMFSVTGGIPKATNWMAVGDPGVGKSTVLLDLLANCKASGGRALFISAEMTSIDLCLYVKRYPKFGDLDIFFPMELEDGECPKQILNEILEEGWDLILIDSFIELCDILREGSGMTSRGAEKYLLDMMNKHNLGNNKTESFSSFICIQQVNKGGNFVGSNKLKHMTTGMLEMRFVDEESQEERYIVFSKNRRGHVGKQMYYDLSATGDVKYDLERFKKAENLKEMKKLEKKKIQEEGLKFDKLFGLDKEDKE